MERIENIPAEIEFLYAIKESPNFCCQECGNQEYRIVMRGAIPTRGELMLMEKLRICDGCYGGVIVIMPPHDFDDNMWDRGWNPDLKKKRGKEQQEETIEEVIEEKIVGDNVEMELSIRGKERE